MRNDRQGRGWAIAAALVVIALVAVTASSLRREKTGVRSDVGTDDVSNRRTEAGAPEAVVLEDGATFALTAAPLEREIAGVRNRMMAYNGGIPGPTLRVRQGSHLTVEFKNELQEPTTVHWHGVRVTNANDGVPHTTQMPVEPGGRFRYELRFPDPGVYWYHPHVREDKQQELGLYGVIVVEPSDARYWPHADREEVLVVDDILAPNGYVAPFFDDMTDHALMGRYGDRSFVNGADVARYQAKAGETVRFFVLNAANARPFAVTLPGAVMTVVGSDAGRSANASVVDRVVLAPSERVVAQVTFPRAGEYAIEHRSPERTMSLGAVEVSASDEVAASVADAWTDDAYGEVRKHLDDPVAATWRLDVATSHMMHHMGDGGPIEWEDGMAMMNAHMTDKTTTWKIVDAVTGAENMDIEATWRTGSFVKVRLVNDGKGAHPMHHPIHLHGQRFVVAAVDGVRNDALAWEDTVLVPNGSTVDVVVEVTNPGEWMVHCHIAEHLQSGMMASVKVEGKDLVR